MSVPLTLAGASFARQAALRNALWLGGDKVVSVVLGLLVFGLIARANGATGAGQFSYALAVLQAALGLSLVCSSAALMPRLWRLRDGAALRALSNVFVVRFVASVLAASAVACYVVAVVDDPSRRAVTLVVLAAVPLIEPFQVWSAFWMSRNRNRVPVLTRCAGLAVRLLVVMAALWAGAQAWVVALAWLAEALFTAAAQSASVLRVEPAAALASAVRRRRCARYLAFGARFAAGLWLSHLFLRLDRLWLVEQLDAHTFGVYATAMQLVEVWLQVATLLATSIGPAFLYRALQRSSHWRSHRGTLLLLGGIGLGGLLGAAALGHWLLVLVFGPPFADGYAYLVAGTAAAVLFFVDQIVQVAVTAHNRPGLLALKWGAACIVALATLLLAGPRLGGFAGPLGLALGLLAGWLALGLALAWRDRQHGRAEA
jgi:O-antigen/teichoic acid export membrane protein